MNSNLDVYEKIIALLSPQAQEHIKEWLLGPYDEDTKNTILNALKNDPESLEDSFCSNLEFGTAGLRALTGIGTNRMNIYTVRKITQGLCNYLKLQRQPKEGFSIFIGYDSRFDSPLFAEEAAKVCAGNGIKAVLCNQMRPTPFVSFGCREMKCSAAVVITASHNPKEYNGYKIFWSDGSQVLFPHDSGIAEEIEKIRSCDYINVSERDDFLIEHAGSALDRAYLNAIAKQQLYPNENHAVGSDLKILYTSLHGTGITLLPEALHMWGFTNLHFVDEQVIPDGNFPTVIAPDPEDPNSLKIGVDCLLDLDCDLLIATDPDADRIAVVVNHQGQQEYLTGNQIAILAVEHICKALSERQQLNIHSAFIKSLPTTDLFRVIVEAYGAACFDVLPGFKHVAELMRKWELSQGHNDFQFIFGAEESYGYLLGSQTRDKDAIVSACLICEIALLAKKKQSSLIDQLYSIYKKYGCMRHDSLSIYFLETKLERQNITDRIEQLQNLLPQKINGLNIKIIENFFSSTRLHLHDGSATTLNMPKSHMFVFVFDDDSKVIIRPSGTEPKIKLYASSPIQSFDSYQNVWPSLKEKNLATLNAIKDLLT